jgi:hypothetical protein
VVATVATAAALVRRRTTGAAVFASSATGSAGASRVQQSYLIQIRFTPCSPRCCSRSDSQQHKQTKTIQNEPPVPSSIVLNEACNTCILNAA